MQSMQILKRYGLVIPFLCILVSVAGFYLAREVRSQYVLTDPVMVIDAFASAYRFNNIDQAKRLTSDELWPQIELWELEHDVLPCTTSWLRGEMFGGSWFAAGNPESLDYFKHIPCSAGDSQTKWYCIEVNNQVLEQRKSRWVIVEIGQIRESLEAAYCQFEHE